MRISRWWLAAVPVAALVLVGQAARLPADAPNQTGGRGAGVKAGCNKATAVSRDGAGAVKADCDKTAVSRDGAAKAFLADDRGGGGKAGFKGGKGAKGDQFAGGRGKGVKGKGGKGGDQFAGGRGGKGKGKGGAGFGGRGGQGLSADQIVERLMAFDKNKDGKLTKDELPERMQNLIARGDTNKDGALDKEEVRKLAGDLARDGFAFGGPGGRGGPGAGVGGPFGGRGGPGAPGRAVENALNNLNLSGTTKDKADAALKAHQENVRKLMDQARVDLVQKMKGVLSEQDFKKFKEAVDPPARPATPANQPSELERRLERLQQELELCRELKK